VRSPWAQSFSDLQKTTTDGVKVLQRGVDEWKLCPRNLQRMGVPFVFFPRI